MVTDPQELKDKLSIIEKESDFHSMIPDKPNRPSIVLLVMCVVWTLISVKMYMSGEYWFLLFVGFFVLWLFLDYKHKKDLSEAYKCASEIIEYYKRFEKTN